MFLRFWGFWGSFSYKKFSYKKNVYLTLIFKKTLVVICQNSSQHYIRLKTVLIVSASCTRFSILKCLLNPLSVSVVLYRNQSIDTTREKSRKSQSVTAWFRCGKWGAIHRKFKYLSCGEDEVLGYFQLSNDRNEELVQQSCNFT